MRKKRLFLFLVLLLILTVIVNSETDVFINIGKYIPSLEESSPALVRAVSQASERVSEFTDMIPSPAEIIAYIKNEELPINPSDVAVNAYITDSPMLSFFPDDNICAVMDSDKKLRLFGLITSKDRQHLVISISDMSDNKLLQVTASVNKDNEFSKTITLPSTDADKLKVDVYTGSKAYGEFESWVYNYLYLSRTENGWQLAKSPVYDSNKQLYEKDKSTSEALKSTFSIQANNASVKSLAESVTADCKNDYEKLIKIHDWICSNIYYDTDNINTSETLPYSASEVLSSRRAVCLGFSMLSAAMCRSINIPCNVVSGYALGIGSDHEWTDETAFYAEPNHAWNEAYVDGRWVIFDTTWDCLNKIENGEKVTSENMSHMYFDANLDFFSANHRITEYMKRR